ncbi:hypothetical protein JCM5353_002542, partial [Sporobolomyces roseus]
KRNLSTAVIRLEFDRSILGLALDPGHRTLAGEDVQYNGMLQQDSTIGRGSMEVESVPSQHSTLPSSSNLPYDSAASPSSLPPPRLPSISSLLNSIPPPPERGVFEEGTPSGTPSSSSRNSFDGGRDGLPSLTVSQHSNGQSPSNRLPIPPTAVEPSYPTPPYVDESARFSLENGHSPRNVISTSPNDSLTNWDQSSGGLGSRPYYSAPTNQLPFESLSPFDASQAAAHRQRSASLNTSYQTYPPSVPSQALPSHYGRPYPGFATSSERRSSGGEDRGPPHGGLGPWRNRRRGAESSYDASMAPPQWQQTVTYSPTRPRALSISTADDYYPSRPAWSPNTAMGPPLQHLDPMQRRTESDPYPMEYFHRPFPPNTMHRNGGPLPGGVTNDLSYLRLGPGGGGEMPRNQYIPPALPIPPPLVNAPSDSHSDLRPIILPSGLPGSAPSSAGSTSTSVFSSHSNTGLPTPVSAGPTSSLSSPNTSGLDMMGAGSHGELYNDSNAPTESGKYSCPHCSKRFARPSSLRIHTFSHTGEKPFTCPQCERAFSVQSNLRRHLKIHKNAESAPAPRTRTRTAPQPSTRTNSNNDVGGAELGHRSSNDMEDDEDVDAEAERDESAPPPLSANAYRDPDSTFPSVLMR